MAKFRHELKYLISLREMDIIKRRLDIIMEKDANTVNGGYKIRSLYFDDYWKSSYNEKLMGVHDRRKYRIRIYNDSEKIIKLECKRKVDSYISKTSALLTKEEVEKILDFDYVFLLEKDNKLCKEFYYHCVSRVMRPVVIVDYEREPYVYKPGDVRITFDRDVRATNQIGSFFDSDLPSTYVLEDSKVIMEVKFTEFLPNIIRDVLQIESCEYVAVSKFVDCFEKTNLMNLERHNGI